VYSDKPTLRNQLESFSMQHSQKRPSVWAPLIVISDCPKVLRCPGIGKTHISTDRRIRRSVGNQVATLGLGSIRRLDEFGAFQPFLLDDLSKPET
jgi:hypothetical protein